MKWMGLLGVGALAVAVFQPTEKTPEPRDVIGQSMAASVQLFAERADGKRRAASGVVLASGQEGTSLVLTAAHLLVPAVDQSVTVARPGRPERLAARILALDEAEDIAILEVEDLPIQPVRLQDSATLGDPVWVVSFPWGQRGTVVGGAVSQISQTPARDGMPIEGPVGLIDAAVSYGTSGGGVFDARSGRLVGIVRGYRTAKIALPDSGRSLEFPIAGETTVIPVNKILCALSRTGLDSRLSPTKAAVPLCDEA